MLPPSFGVRRLTGWCDHIPTSSDLLLQWPKGTNETRFVGIDSTIKGSWKDKQPFRHTSQGFPETSYVPFVPGSRQ